MENEEREVRGMAVVWKRLRALAVFLLVLSMLESDGIEQEIMRISIGLCGRRQPAGQLWAGRRQI